MIYLLLAILFSSLNHLLFTAFARFRINLLSAVVTNYAVCVGIGFTSAAWMGAAGIRAIAGQSWFPLSVLQGGLFVACFFLIGLTTSKYGVAIATLSTRLSVVIPTMMAFWLYDDTITALKLMGILLAFAALFLNGFESRAASSPARRAMHILPLVLFAAFGIHTALVKFVQARFLGSVSYHSYVMAAFSSAFVLSALFLLWRILTHQHSGRWRDLPAGLVLGCANYGSVYFLLKTLSVAGWQSSQIFPTISIAVVMVSAISAWAVFQERIHWKIAGAIFIGAVSIVLVNL